MSKQIHDLTASDLDEYPTWLFPMDESVEDETSVRPIVRGEIVPDGLQRIVRAVFRDQTGRTFRGYVYFATGSNVEDTRPVAWLAGVCITFWNGMVRPEDDYVLRAKMLGLKWPVTFATNAPGAPCQQGSLSGIYYWDGSSVQCISLE